MRELKGNSGSTFLFFPILPRILWIFCRNNISIMPYYSNYVKTTKIKIALKTDISRKHAWRVYLFSYSPKRNSYSRDSWNISFSVLYKHLTDLVRIKLFLVCILQCSSSHSMLAVYKFIFDSLNDKKCDNFKSNEITRLISFGKSQQRYKSEFGPHQ